MVDAKFVQIDHNKIDISHRQRADESAGIIVKFTNRTSRNIFYDSRKVLSEKLITSKSLGYTVEKSIYIP